MAKPRLIDTWLVLDTDYLCHRARHVFGKLSYRGASTGVIYGILHDIANLSVRFKTQRLIFCWDHPVKMRQTWFPDYKRHRKKPTEDKTDQERDEETQFYRQVELLRTEYLPTIGFQNHLRRSGYESDDMIAFAARLLSHNDLVIMVTADQDLFQCIRGSVDHYNPFKHERLTLQKFITRYGIHPREWAKVKAIAGCSTDNIPGIRGVGEKTAIKYILNQLPPTNKKYVDIKDGWKSIVLRNKRLVKLPLPGLNPFTPKRDTVTQSGWDTVTKALGMKPIRYEQL